MSLTRPPESSAPSFLQYTGIPASWLKKRPKLPSRNWLIFLSTSAAIGGLYAYDRRKCRQLRNEYIDKVKHLSEVPLPPLGLPRKVTVYGSKWPGDEDADRSMKYFRKYVKPILVAAAVDYEMINGKRHGVLADLLADKIKSQRRVELGLDPPPQEPVVPLLGQKNQTRWNNELEGGIIIIGRQTFKEFMHGLKRGWSEPLDLSDREELLSRELEVDDIFDEVDVGDPNLSISRSASDTDIPEKTRGSPFFPPPYLNTRIESPASSPDTPSIDSVLNAPPALIPTYPPMLLVPFTNLVGISLVPRMIWDFFNQRRKVRDGAKAAYRLVTGTPRPIRGPTSSFEGRPGIVEHDPSSDLSFDLQAETYFKSSALPSEIDKARASYSEGLPAKIRTARQLARGEREPTKDERNYPPPTEVELRTERMNKELRWRSDLSGWKIVNTTAPVAWDPRFAGALSVYLDEDLVNEQENDTRLS